MKKVKIKVLNIFFLNMFIFYDYSFYNTSIQIYSKFIPIVVGNWLTYDVRFPAKLHTAHRYSGGSV